MQYDPEKHARRSIRLAGYDYRQSSTYFVTICAHNRGCIFGTIDNYEVHLSEVGKVVQQCWESLPTHFPNIQLDQFVIMPNHIHGLFYFGDSSSSASLGSVIGLFKAISTKRAKEQQLLSDKSLWQRNYHERIVRSETELIKLREYIVANPVEWNLDELNPSYKF